MDVEVKKVEDVPDAFLSRVSEHWNQYKFRDVVLPENNDLFLERSAPLNAQSPLRTVPEDHKEVTVNLGKTEIWKNKMLETDRQSIFIPKKKERRKERTTLSKS